MTTTHQFTGQADVYSDVDKFHGPKPTEVKFAATLAANGVDLTVADFTVEGFKDIEVKRLGLTVLVDLDVTMPQGGKGAYTRATGAVTIDGILVFQFKFKGTNLPGNKSKLRLASFSTGPATLPQKGAVTGSPANESGALTLAGAGTFKQGPDELRERRCGMLLVGTFIPPLPRP